MKIKNTVLGIFFLLSLVACSTSEKTLPTPPLKSVPYVGSLQVKKTTLKNGLKLLIVEDHSSPTFVYQTWFRVGSRNEIKKYTGLAHLFEHLMFKATKNYKDGEFDRILESSGVEGENAFTSRDFTAYIQELPNTKLDLIAKLESDRMVNLVVDEAAFKTEREVVQNERRFRNENSPDGLMYQEVFGLAFNDHPYHWPVIGYEEDLNRMVAKDAENFYRSYYAPDRATIVVVGDLNAEDVLKTVEKYYGNIPGAYKPNLPITQEPEQKAPRTKTLKLNIQVQKIMMGYHIPDISNTDTAAISALRSVMSLGKSSRLEKALVDSGIATTESIYDLDDKDPSLLIITANLQKGHKATDAEKVILKEFEKIQKTLVSDAELEKSKNQLLFEFYKELQDPGKKAHFLGLYETLLGDFTRGLETIEQLSTVTPEQVREVANKYLKPNNRTVIYGVQK